MGSRERKSEGKKRPPADVYTADELRAALLTLLDKSGLAYKLRGDALITEPVPGVELVLRSTWCYIHVGGAVIAACEWKNLDSVYSKTLMNLLQTVLVEAVGPDSRDFESFTLSTDESAGCLFPAATLDYKGLPVWDFGAAGLPTPEQLRAEITRTKGLADMLERGPNA